MKKKSIREVIVGTATRLFYRQGYSNTGINQIVDEAGIAKSSLYHYFKSKEDLLMAYLEETGAKTHAALKAAADEVNEPRDKVVAIFDYLEGLVQQKDFFGCNFLNIVYELPEDAVRIREQVKYQKDTVRQLFAEILQPIHKERLADEIYTLFEGALIGNKVHSDTWPIVRARDIVKKLI
ncbi:TetR/AcrR family transcriptional regulator [Chitinophaga agrisoli]|uniref:TetR/AcrR family transcriptional regulator n=1 Tax=Chitinophaga agrisoli TaxID=2607653 RepID=A0A5B2VVI1_9BACT|nr:TetR/AcrR family transcriptional regulator [Chitinophaga agrisoli]KAA2243281.1 TetR/AcrR family transcriptional regulator [Chitinophaga agrisoli]